MHIFYLLDRLFIYFFTNYFTLEKQIEAINELYLLILWVDTYHVFSPLRLENIFELLRKYFSVWFFKYFNKFNKLFAQQFEQSRIVNKLPFYNSF